MEQTCVEVVVSDKTVMAATASGESYEDTGAASGRSEAAAGERGRHHRPSGHVFDSERSQKEIEFVRSVSGSDPVRYAPALRERLPPPRRAGNSRHLTLMLT